MLTATMSSRKKPNNNKSAPPPPNTDNAFKFLTTAAALADNGGKRKVSVSWCMYKMNHIDTKAQQFDAELRVDFKWILSKEENQSLLTFYNSTQSEGHRINIAAKQQSRDFFPTPDHKYPSTINFDYSDLAEGKRSNGGGETSSVATSLEYFWTPRVLIRNSVELKSDDANGQAGKWYTWVPWSEPERRDDWPSLTFKWHLAGKCKMSPSLSCLVCLFACFCMAAVSTTTRQSTRRCCWTASPLTTRT